MYVEKDTKRLAGVELDISLKRYILYAFLQPVFTSTIHMLLLNPEETSLGAQYSHPKTATSKSCEKIVERKYKNKQN